MMDPVQSPGQEAWGDYEPMGGLCIYVFLCLFMCVFVCGSVCVLVCLWLVMYFSMCLLVSLHVCLCFPLGFRPQDKIFKHQPFLKKSD